MFFKGSVLTLLQPVVAIFLHAVNMHKPTLANSFVEMSRNGSRCKMEVDTSVDYSIMSRLNIENLPLRCVVKCSAASCAKYVLPVIVVNYEDKLICWVEIGLNV